METGSYMTAHTTTQSWGSNFRKPCRIYCARMGAFRTPCASLDWSLPAIRRLLRACLCIENFRSRLGAETGSMTGWWVTSLCPTASTTQSSRTAETVVD
jgi:hypothetical protein